MTIRPAAIVVMGVAGAGKTTVGRALAERLGWPFLDADELHPPANVAKMRSGLALGDADRAPWLAAVAAWIGAHVGEGCVVACSALKRAYRTRLAAGGRSPTLVYVEASRRLVSERMAARAHHYFPISLIASQYEALEPPTAEEAAIVSDAGLTVAEQVEGIVAVLSQMPAYHS